MNIHERGFPQHGNLGGNQKMGKKLREYGRQETNPMVSWSLRRNISFLNTPAPPPKNYPCKGRIRSFELSFFWATNWWLNVTNISWILWRVYFWYKSHTSDVEDCCFRPNDPETNVGTVAPVNGAAPQKFVAWKLRDPRPSFFLETKLRQYESRFVATKPPVDHKKMVLIGSGNLFPNHFTLRIFVLKNNCLI